MEKNNIDLLIKELAEAYKQAEIEEAKYSFFNDNEFQKRFKTLLAFTCIVGSINENMATFVLKDVDRSYIIEKYHLFIKNHSYIKEDEIEKLFKFIDSIDKLYKPDTLISKWEQAFGEGSFFTISINNHYRTGLHALIKKQIFDVYMTNLFHDSKKYKIWKILNENKKEL
jgi:hypothetical protein